MNTESRIDPADEALILAVAEGDRKAFETLLTRYERRIFSFALRYLGNRAEAEEVFQETFFRVFSRADRYRSRYRFSTWVYTIARNLCLDALRKRRTHPETSLDGLFEARENPDRTETIGYRGSLPPETNPEDSPSRIFEIAEKREIFRKALERLPENQREAVLLRHYAGLSTRETAEIMGCTEGTAKSRLHYAFLALERALRPVASELLDS